jgi:hypothetical protein
MKRTATIQKRICELRASVMFFPSRKWPLAGLIGLKQARYGG